MLHRNLLPDKDSKCWDAMRQGNEQAFARLYDDYFRVLYNYGRKICMDATRVEDAIHDVFVDLWRFRENLSSTTSVRFYLYRALRRRLVRNDAKNTWLVEDNFFIDAALSFASESSEQAIIASEEQDLRLQQLKKLLNDLSPRQYEALVLHFYDEFSYEEIASIMNVNTQSARNLVHRGLVQLRQYARHIISLALFLSLL